MKLFKRKKKRQLNSRTSTNLLKSKNLPKIAKLKIQRQMAKQSGRLKNLWSLLYPLNWLELPWPGWLSPVKLKPSPRDIQTCPEGHDDIGSIRNAWLTMKMIKIFVVTSVVAKIFQLGTYLICTWLFDTKNFETFQTTSANKG